MRNIHPAETQNQTRERSTSYLGAKKVRLVLLFRGVWWCVLREGITSPTPIEKKKSGRKICPACISRAYRNCFVDSIEQLKNSRTCVLFSSKSFKNKTKIKEETSCGAEGNRFAGFDRAIVPYF